MEKEFTRQAEHLITIGYPQAAQISVESFRKLLEPLRKKVLTLSASEEKEGYIPFVIVVKHSLISTEKAMSLISRNNKSGVISMYPRKPEDFTPIESVSIPSSEAYLLVDIDRGKETINVAPQDALQTITKQHRSPLTIDEGMAIIIQFPEFLQKNNCFSLLASRGEDKRVPAIWLSENKPKLGWCWDGNPHTWLGSASCSTRMGI